MRIRTSIAGVAAFTAVLAAPLPAHAGAQPDFEAQTPAIAVNNDGRMELFAVTRRGQLQHNWENSPGSAGQVDGFSGWDGIGGDGQVTGPVTALRRPDGRLQVYARGTDSSLKETHQTNFGIWSGWASLGGQFTGVPSAVLAPGGRAVIYVRGQDNAVWVFLSHAPNSDSYFLDRLNGGLIRNDPVATVRPGGGVEVYARGLDDRLYRFEDDLATVDPRWEYDINSDKMVNRPAVGFEGGLAKVFMANDRQELFASKQTTRGANAQWLNQIGFATGIVGDLALVENGGLHGYMRWSTNEIEWFDGSFWHLIDRSGTMRFPGNPAAIARGGVEHVIAVAADGKMRHCRRNTNGTFTGWHLV